MAERPKDYTTHYPSDVTDQEWEFCAPYLTLMDPKAPQRRHNLRALFNGLRYVAKTGVQWEYLPADFLPAMRSTSKRGAGCELESSST